MVSKTLLRSMPKAYYDPLCQGHFGLSLQHYAHFTSPIRRYPDLIVHRSLRKFFFEKRFNQIGAFENKLSEIARKASERERNAIDAERAVEDFKKCEFMKQKIGKSYTGIISGVQSFGFFVELENTVEGLIRMKDLNEHAYYSEASKMIITKTKQYKIGDKIQIVVDKVDLFAKTIDFKLKEKKYEKSNRKKSKSKT